MEKIALSNSSEKYKHTDSLKAIDFICIEFNMQHVQIITKLSKNCKFTMGSVQSLVSIISIIHYTLKSLWHVAVQQLDESCVRKSHLAGKVLDI